METPDLLVRALASAGSASEPVRSLVILAHPDDEVLAVGARLERFTRSRFVTLTDGAPLDGADARHHGFSTLEGYRAARQAELHAALAHARLAASVAAPFPTLHPVPDQAATLHLVSLTRSLLTVLEDFAPQVILTHPYEGGHPDHDACAFAVHSALRLYEQQAKGSITASPVCLIEAPFYHADGHGGMRTGRFLQGEGRPPIEFTLSATERSNKEARLACFRSQAETLRQFDSDRELFRIAPPYDFTQPPHEGKLLYEHFDWGMDGTRFRALAREAEAELRTQHAPGENPEARRNQTAGALA